MSTIRILIADDHALLRAGVRSLLQAIPDFEVVGEASDGREALHLVETLRPHVLLMDISMPNMNGLMAAQKISVEFPDVHIIILSMHTNDEFVGQAIQNGVAGYLLKNAEAAELEFAVKAVAGGETYLTPSVSKRMMGEYVDLLNGKPAAKGNLLTPRQTEILQLIAEGRSTKEIAGDLQISVKTVETHRAQLMDRLDIHDIPGLVRYAMRTGLVSREM
jgi:DNA-binding NarL/FixJ family response regulator